jgi:hypothetical protein
MLDCLNNFWVIIICLILFFVIIQKICNLNKPFDEQKFLIQFQNQEKLKKKLNLNSIHDVIPKLTNFYVGVNSTKDIEVISKNKDKK